VRLIGAALFAGLALIAGAMVVTGDRWAWSADERATYDGYEPVVRTWMALSGGTKVARIEQVKGPFYRVAYRIDGGRDRDAPSST
jgi:hypothetical protein